MKKSVGSPPTCSSAVRRNPVPHPINTFGYAEHSRAPLGSVIVNTTNATSGLGLSGRARNAARSATGSTTTGAAGGSRTNPQFGFNSSETAACKLPRGDGPVKVAGSSSKTSFLIRFLCALCVFAAVFVFLSSNRKWISSRRARHRLAHSPKLARPVRMKIIELHVLLRQVPLREQFRVVRLPIRIIRRAPRIFVLLVIEQRPVRRHHAQPRMPRLKRQVRIGCEKVIPLVQVTQPLKCLPPPHRKIRIQRPAHVTEPIKPPLVKRLVRHVARRVPAMKQCHERHRRRLVIDLMYCQVQRLR